MPYGFARRWWSMFQRRNDSLLSLLESLAPTESFYVSSTLREESSSTEDLNLQQWSSLESSVDDSCFSGKMSDVVSLEQQRKEELAAMSPPSESSIIYEGSRRTEHWVDDARRRSEDERWPNSNAIEAPPEEGSSRAPRVGAGNPSSQSTRSMLQDLTFTAGMSYVQTQDQGVTRPCANGKHKKVRPPMMNVGDELGARDMPCARSVVGSAVSSQRSSVYKAAVLEAQADTQRAFAGLASTRAECNEQHQAITSNIVEVRQCVQQELQISDQLRTAQSQQNVRVEAIRNRLGGMNDLLLQRELRVETQIYDLSNRMNSVLHAINVLRREQSLP